VPASCSIPQTSKNKNKHFDAQAAELHDKSASRYILSCYRNFRLFRFFNFRLFRFFKLDKIDEFDIDYSLVYGVHSLYKSAACVSAGITSVTQIPETGGCNMLLSGFLLFLWCLPQNLFGYIEYIDNVNNGNVVDTFEYRDTEVIVLKGDDFFAYAYGEYIFLSERYLEERIEVTLAHEYGHVLQSRRFGPLYGLIVGIPSWYHQLRSPRDREYADRYYEYWPEIQADRLGEAEEIRESPAWRLQEWYDQLPDAENLLNLIHSGYAAG